MLRIVSLVTLLMVFALSVPFSSEAAKKRTWKATAASTSSATPSISAKLTGWKQYLTLTFRGVSSTTGIDYELTYSGNGIEQGVFGSIKPAEGNVARTLFFGTCSHNVCVSHRNITNARLAVTYKLKSGQTLVKKYKIKY